MNRFILKMQDVFNFVKGIVPTHTTDLKDEMVVKHNGKYYHIKVTEIENKEYCHPKVKELVELLENHEEA